MKSLAQKLISQSAVEAERMIAIVRMTGSGLLCFALIFLLLLMASEGTHVRSFELSFALATAVAYFTLGVTSYYCAQEERYRPWMSWALAWGEVFLISLNIYSDVHEPNTSSLFALASPVTILVAIVMVVQVLRYDVKLLLWTQGSLLAIIALIVFHDPQLNDTVPPESVTELLFLYKPPPNVMRLVMFGILLMIIVLSVRRSRRLMEKVALETEQIENQKRFLPAELIDHLGGNDMLGVMETREEELTIMFIDVRGFTKLSEAIGPSATAAFLSNYRSMVMNAVKDGGGIVDKFIGDGALVVFGLDSPIEKGAQSAMAAGLSLLNSVEQWNSHKSQNNWELKIAVAIHTGRLMVGTIGDERRLEFTVTGSTVNLASRLEGFAKENNLPLVVSQSTYQHLSSNFPELLFVEDKRFRGFNEAISVYGLLNRNKETREE